jgi:heat shock protein HslJ
VRRLTVLATFVALTTAAALAGCTTTAPGPGLADPALRGEWSLASASDGSGDLPLTPDTVSLSVTDSVTSTGETECGGYTVSVYGTATNLHVEPALALQGRCQSPGAAEVQHRYLVALATVNHARLGNGTLELDAAGVTLKYVASLTMSLETIEHRTWHLALVATSYSSTNRDFVFPAGETFELDDATHFSGTTPCRSFAGTYKRQAGKLLIQTTVTPPGNCLGEQGVADGVILSVFSGLVTITTQGDVIRVSNDRVDNILMYMSAQFEDPNYGQRPPNTAP